MDMFVKLLVIAFKVIVVIILVNVILFVFSALVYLLRALCMYVVHYVRVRRARHTVVGT